MERTSPHRRLGLVLPVLLSVLAGQAQNIGINTTGIAPNINALLDVNNEGVRRGVLLPRLSTADRTGMGGLSLAEDGLTVYDTTTKSYWYWDGTQWVEMAAGAGSGWGLFGNAGTDDAVNFLGTTNPEPLMIRTGGVERVRITTNGQIETLNTGESVFVGEGAGANDDLTANQNVFVGRDAGVQNISGGSNTAIGYSAMRENTTSWYNTAVGHGAMYQNTTGSSNVAMGVGSLANNTSGSYNIAMGHGSLSYMITGWQNTAIGSGAMENTNGSDNNTALGSWALRYNVTGGQNTASGALALHSNVAGSSATAIGALAMRYSNNTTTPFENTNVAVGYSALQGSANPANNTGMSNTAVGYQSLMANATGDLNVGVGYVALNINTSGTSNTAIGAITLAINTTGDDNTAAGRQALFQNTTGDKNSGFGSEALSNSYTGSHNTAVGFAALRSNDAGEGNVGVGEEANVWNFSGSYNTTIGSYAGHGAVPHTKSGSVLLGYSAGYNELTSDRLYIENSSSATPLIYGEFDTDMVRINHNLGIGSSWFGGGTKVLSFEVGTPPVPNAANAMIYAETISGITELRAMDGTGFSTTFSPHNFSLAPRSEPMAWSFYSENAKLDRKVNVDMMRAVRLVEQLSGEQLVYMEDMKGGEVAQLKRENDSLVERIERLEEELAGIKAAIGQTHDKRLRRASARKQ